MKVYVVMSNDYPYCVFDSEQVAQRFCDEKNATDKAEAQRYGRSRIYWKLYEFNIKHDL